MTVRLLVILVLVGLAVAGVMLLWRGDARPIAVDAPPTPLPGTPALPDGLAEAELLVAWTAHSGARLEPCGCVAGMHGGLARRASLLSRVSGERLLLLECGGWSGGSADYQRLRAGYFLRALQEIGCPAVALGRAEFALGRSALSALLADAKHTGVICANLREREGLAVAESVTVRRGARSLVVTAVVPATAAGDGLAAGDPVEALLRVIDAHPHDQVVVIADFDEAGLLELAKAVPGLALVVGGAVKGPSLVPLAVGATRVVHVANDGKTLGWWPWGGAECRFELIEDSVPDAPVVRQLIHDYQERLGALDLAIDDRSGMTNLVGSGSAARYVGSSSCTPCHAGAAAVHAASRHGHALDTLRARNYHHDPDCLRCHVTGLALPDGYSRRGERPAMGEVSCESCHGRGSLHIAERTAGRPASGTLEPVTQATCLRCHDRENSPAFTYDAYWPRIAHDSR